MTASKSFGLSNTRRKSLYFLAFGNLWPAASTAFWFTSQSTVMFSAAIPRGWADAFRPPRRPPPPSPFILASARPPQAIIAMSHSLGLRVIGEGVETIEQLEFLREHGCDEVQGYYFSAGLPEAEATALLRESFAPAQASNVTPFGRRR